MKKILFSIMLFTFCIMNVFAEERTFKIYLDKPFDYPGNTSFCFVDLDTGEEEIIVMEGNYKEVTLSDNLKRLKVYEIDRDEHYVANGWLYTFNFNNSDEAEIHYKYKVKIYQVNWQAFYLSIDGYVNEQYFPDLKVYSLDNEYIMDVKESTFYIANGSYFVKDMITNSIHGIDVFDNPSDAIFYEMLIDGIKVDTPISSFCNKDKCYEFNVENDLLTVEGYIYPDNYYINGKLFEINNSSPKLEKSDKNIVVINLLDEEKKDDESNNIPELNDKEDNKTNIPDVSKTEETPDNLNNDVTLENPDLIIIDVPNTGSEYNEIIYYYKKYCFN